MKFPKTAVFWLAALALFIIFVATFKSILLPFILGMAIAYFLNPVIEKLGRAKVSRNWAALIMLGVFFTVVLGFFAALLPVAYRELTSMASDFPAFMNKVSAHIDPYLDQIRRWTGTQRQSDIQDIVSGNAQQAAGVVSGVAAGVATGSMAVLDFLTLVVITPVMAYFMMVKWPVITGTVEDLMPRQHKDTIMSLLKEIDKKLSAFVRGQLSVAAILGLGYAIALSIAGLNYGFLIGLVAGLLSIIPLAGSTLGLLVSVAVAWFQSGEITYMAIIAAIFFIGQIIEGYFLTPKLVGDSVGLHPLWVFFALMAGGSLFGIVGVLLAVPVASVASVLVAFGISRYKKSSYYQDKKLAAKQKQDEDSGVAKKN